MTRRLTALAFVGLLAAAGAVSSNESPVPPADFARDVEPLLSTSCFPCHGPAAAQGDLRLDAREAALKGGASGPAIVPGHAADSLLLKRVSSQAGTRMPMGLAPLTDPQIAMLRAWIDQGAAWGAPAASHDAGSVDFTAQIQPIFKANCTRCHGPDQQKSQLRLDSRTNALKGAFRARHPPGQGEGQPPDPAPPGTGEAPDALRGRAPCGRADRLDPRVDRCGCHRAERRGRRREARPPLGLRQTRTTTGAGGQEHGWVRNPIDAFILSRLEQEGLAPSPEASRETLLRRLSLDLVGLPPTLAEVDAFVADTSPDAYEKTVDRLLASPHYGERWARPWLDLARYADSNGYEKDRLRVAWKYRDWVIDALNKDMSFRDFTIQQIAGDMLKDATVDQRIATGFHRNTLLNQEGGIDVEEARWKTLVDRVNTTSSVWLGSTMACAECHNHKFDPFSQKDYYRMLAFFDNIDYRVQGLGETVMDKWIVEPELDLPTDEQAARRTTLRAEIQKWTETVEKKDLTAAIRAWELEIAGPPPAWTPLEPERLVSASGCTLSKNVDRSVTVKGDTPDKDTYTVVVRAPLAGITAFRLEAMDDATLPEKGPGRSSSGNFVLTRFAVATGAQGEKPVALTRAQADFSQTDIPSHGPSTPRPRRVGRSAPRRDEPTPRSSCFALRFRRTRLSRSPSTRPPATCSTRSVASACRPRRRRIPGEACRFRSR